MADEVTKATATPATAAAKPAAKEADKPKDERQRALDSGQYEEDETGNLVFVGGPDLTAINHQREVFKAEAEHLDYTDGPADNFTGDASEELGDPFFSPDPFKRPIPPGSDDPSKL